MNIQLQFLLRIWYHFELQFLPSFSHMWPLLAGNCKQWPITCHINATMFRKLASVILPWPGGIIGFRSVHFQGQNMVAGFQPQGRSCQSILLFFRVCLTFLALWSATLVRAPESLATEKARPVFF
jgi:hypothetical protein